MSEENRGPWIETYKGEKFFLGDPKADEVNFQDIAHAISMQCRFTGQLKRMWSVGQHCLFVAEMAAEHAPEDVAERYGLLGLFHDFEEAYISDISTPMKRILFEQDSMSKYRFEQMKESINAAIYEAADLDPPTEYEHQIIKFFDIKALIMEGFWFLPRKAHTFIDIMIPRLEEMAVDNKRLQKATVDNPTLDPDVRFLHKWDRQEVWTVESEIMRRIRRFRGS